MNETTLPLSDEEVERYNDQGYLLLSPSTLESDVCAAVGASVDRILQTEGPECVHESDGETVRSVYGVHRTSVPVHRLAQSPEMIAAVTQLLGESSYIHQSKVNVKAALAGEQWGWHQDFIYWFTDDHLPRPDLVNVAVFLDEVTHLNGPLTFVPGSHKNGVLSGDWNDDIPSSYADDPSWIKTLTSKEHFEVPVETIREQVQTHGFVAPTGPAGSILLFHPNLLHCSPANLSPFRRAMLILAYNAKSNLEPNRPSTRPWFLADTGQAQANPLESVTP